MKRITICIDPGHGMSNRRSGVYDPGATVKVGGKDMAEASIVMDWANELRALLRAANYNVVRTRKDAMDPAPVGERAGIAREYESHLMISLHCNAANGKAEGTETFYRGAGNKALAQKLNDAVVNSLGTKDRGVKTEAQSQHKSLAVLNFPKAFLIELGFIDHAGDRERIRDETLMTLACGEIVQVIEQFFQT